MGSTVSDYPDPDANAEDARRDCAPQSQSVGTIVDAEQGKGDPFSPATTSPDGSPHAMESTALVTEDVVEDVSDGSDGESCDDAAYGVDPQPCVDKIIKSLKHFEGFWTYHECAEIEHWIDETVRHADSGLFVGERTVDRTKNRGKYFFGHGYTYGRGMRGQEELLHVGAVDPIPEWMQRLLIKPLEDRGIVPKGWIDSAVMNDYYKGSSIVSHVDPPRLFSRPILTASFFCPARLVFGASFDHARSTQPVYMQPVRRGSLLSLDGYAANRVTHGIRPEDLLGYRRVSIVLRHVIQAPVPEPARVDSPIGVSDLTWTLLWTVQGIWSDARGPSSSRQMYVVTDWMVAVFLAAAPAVPTAVLKLLPSPRGLELEGAAFTAVLDRRGAKQAPTRLRWLCRGDDKDVTSTVSNVWVRFGV